MCSRELISVQVMDVYYGIGKWKISEILAKLTGHCVILISPSVSFCKRLLHVSLGKCEENNDSSFLILSYYFYFSEELK